MMRDRLIRLSMLRAALHWAGLGSLDVYRHAGPEQLARLGDHALTVRRLVRDGRPNVLGALFGPVAWHAAALLIGPHERLLVIDGQEPIRYRADDTEGE